MECSAKRRSCLAVFALVSAVPAQEIILPPSHASQSGTGATNVPFGRSTAARGQFVYDASMFAGASRVISRIDFRIDEGITAAAKRVEVEIRLSSLGAPVTRVQSSFAANRGSDEQVVLSRTLLDLPAAGASASPNPFDVSIPLDQSFSYDPANGALVLEVIVFGQPPGAYPLDQAFVCDSARLGYGPAGCGRPGAVPLTADSVTSQVTWGGTLTLRVSNAQPGATTGLMFGFRESGVWRGITFPFDLSTLGASGCWFSIDAIATSVQSADGSGTAFFTSFIPSQPDLVGSWYRFQGIAIDPLANALGIVTSQPHKVQICGWEPVARVFAGGTQSAIGLREVGVAPVVRLR